MNITKLQTYHFKSYELKKTKISYASFSPFQNLSKHTYRIHIIPSPSFFEKDFSRRNFIFFLSFQYLSEPVILNRGSAELKEFVRMPSEYIYVPVFCQFLLVWML